MAEQVGPVAQVIVHDVIKNLDLRSGLMTPAIYARFLSQISSELPPDIDSLEFCEKCRNQAV